MDLSPLNIARKRGHHDIVELLTSEWSNSYGRSPPHGICPNSPPSKKSPKYKISSPVRSSGTISPTPAGVYSDIRPKISNDIVPGINIEQIHNKHPGKRKRKVPNNTKRKHELIGNNYQTKHPPACSQLPVGMYHFPTPRPSTEKQLPDLTDSDVLQGMEGMEEFQVDSCLEMNYPAWTLANELVVPVHMQNSSIGAPIGNKFQFTQMNFNQLVTNPISNDLLPTIDNQLRRQLEFQQNAMVEGSGHPFLTPPSAGLQSPNDLGSPLNVGQPSPFLTPSPESWTTSPGHSTSESSVC